MKGRRGRALLRGAYVSQARLAAPSPQRPSHPTRPLALPTALGSMSYYFCIVGTRDNPVYQADLASKPSTSSGPASFFSSASNSNPSNAASSSSGMSSGDQRGSLDSVQSSQSTLVSTSSSSGGVFGFGNALGALAGGLSAAREVRNSYGPGGAGAGGGGQGGPPTSGDGKGLGFGRYNDKDVLQMIAHSSLDVVEDKQFVNGAM